MIERLLTNELSKKRWREFKQNRMGVASLCLLLVLGFFSVTAEFWANSKPLVLTYNGTTFYPIFKNLHPSDIGITNTMQIDFKKLQQDPNAKMIWPMIEWDPFVRNSDLAELPGAPSTDNWFGTDEGGRDVAARLLYGFRYSLGFALSVWILCSILGAITGALMGYLAGWVDLAGQRLIEVVESLPTLMILITLGSIFKPGLDLLIIFSSLFGWVGVSLYFRAEFLRLRRLEFVDAARAMGASHSRILLRHVLPNSLTPWISMSPFMIAGGVIGLAVLDYLGYGLQAPAPSWGELLGQAQKYFRTAWWLAVYPTTALALTLMLLNLVGLAVRDAFDPRKS